MTDVNTMKREKSSMSKVDHPSHYNTPGRKECIVEMEEKFGLKAVLNFCQLNAYKYRYRYEMKNGEEDLEKARWYDLYGEYIEEKMIDKSMTLDRYKEIKEERRKQKEIENKMYAEKRAKRLAEEKRIFDAPLGQILK